MLYTSVDELEHFEYHDAEVVRIEVKDHRMTWITKYLNATTKNTQNSYLNDMCVPEAEIVFESFEIKSLTFNEKGVYDINDNCIKSIPRREASLSECMSILINEAKGYCWILGMHMEETAADGKHGFAADFSIVTDDDVFDLLFEFDHVVISWDRFSGKAWYEESPWKENAPNRP